MGKVVGEAHASPRVGEQPLHRAEERRRDLQGGGVLVGNEFSGLVNVEEGADPPAGERMPHEETAELVTPADDVVVHDPLVGLEVVVAHVQLVEARQRGVGGAVRVVDGGPVDDGVVVLDGEPLRDREGLTVTNHHPDDLAARDPGPDPGLTARMTETDLVLRARRVRVRAGWQVELVGAPAQLGGRDPFLIEAFYRPGVHELVLAFGLDADLSVALGDMDHLDVEGLSQPVPRRLLPRASGSGPSLKTRTPSPPSPLVHRRGEPCRPRVATGRGEPERSRLAGRGVAPDPLANQVGDDRDDHVSRECDDGAGDTQRGAQQQPGQ